MGVVVIPDTEMISPEPEIVTVDVEEEEDKENDLSDGVVVTGLVPSRKAQEISKAEGKGKTKKKSDAKALSPENRKKTYKQGKEKNQRKKGSKKPVHEAGGNLKSKTIPSAKKTKDRRHKRTSSGKGNFFFLQFLTLSLEHS